MGDTRTILIITGVSGSRKTTIATTLAEQLGWPFKEGDELHLPSNNTKMHSGHPLVVYLHGEKAVIAARLAERKGHFMPRSLLDSQFAVLEEPDPTRSRSASRPIGW